jgi:anti-sigma regulatory factor (Ser/Thr protein kinase)
MAEQVSVQVPLADEFVSVVRIIVSGVAERAKLAFEDMDDLQLAVERLLAEAGHEGQASLSFELGNGYVRTRIGPLREHGLAEALQRLDRTPGQLTLAWVLDTVVDSYGVEETSGEGIVVRLEKLVEKSA